jgi:UPF0042 nucleotide-binding protein
VDRLVVITGLSGSGKTLAANCLEDLGYFCVDNLPVGLIPPFCDLIHRSGDQIPRAALVIDAREGAFLDQFPDILRGLRAGGVPVQLLFFECADDVLKRRFSETRRPHPMARAATTLEQAIHNERQALERLRELADRIIDTSRFTAHELRNFLKNAYGLDPRTGLPYVYVVSFGFKYGVPAEADLVFDVRFLPNPYFTRELQHLDGRHPDVLAFLDATELTGQFERRLREFLDFLIPLYGAEGKTYLTVAIGCTGGRHRSVALAERLGAYLVEQNYPASVSHRDVGRDS